MAHPAIPVTELFWSILDKADRHFSRLRDLPAAFSRQRGDGAEFQKAFKHYTRLWKLQQEHRQKLVDAGLRRWEVGEIASRIAQLYYGRYLRTADAASLTEAYIFYEAILTREYFKDGGGGTAHQQDPALANKQLRFLGRFLIVCLLLGRREMVSRLVGQLRATVDDCRRNFQEAEFREWKHVVQEIVRFLKADTPFMNMRTLRYSFAFDSHPDSLSYIASCDVKRSLVLRDVVLSSYHQNEVKFAELTLNTFRMVQCLEWEPSGFFSQRSDADEVHNEMDVNRINLLQDIRDPTLPPNPRKVTLYRPSVTQYLLVLATICEDLPPDGILLIYLSAAGVSGLNPPMASTPGTSSVTDKTLECFNETDLCSPRNSPPDSPTPSCLKTKETNKNEYDACLWLGSRGSGGSNCLYACDFIPFTRKPLFFIIDSNNSHAFKVLCHKRFDLDHRKDILQLKNRAARDIFGTERGVTVAMLLSPVSQYLTTAAHSDTAHYQSGSQFTMFLTAPVQAFCLLIGISGISVDKDTYGNAEKLFSLSLSDWENALVGSNSLHPVWSGLLGDPFLRRLLLRFIFCRAVFALYAPTFRQEEFLPSCLPHLPDSVAPDDPVSQSAIMRLANTFGSMDHFVFSDGIVLPDPPKSAESTILMAADINESHFLAVNGC